MSFRSRAFALLVARLALSPVALAASQVSVSWDDNSDAETGFNVERAKADGAFVQLGSVGADITTYIDTTISDSTAYSYRIAAYNEAGMSAYSNITSVTTPAATLAPSITTQPSASQAVVAGSDVTLSVVVSGNPMPTLQWKKNGIGIAGATASTLRLSAVISADAATYTVVATNTAGSDVSNSAVLTVQTPQAPVASVAAVAAPSVSPSSGAATTVPPAVITSRLMNLSVRAVPGPDDRALLVGFVIGGATKSMLVRAVGPGLSTYTSAQVFEDPKLTLYDGAKVVATNDNWLGTDALKSSFSRLGAFPLPDTSKDSGVLINLAPKAYTANVTGPGTGLAMAEIYDADTALQPAGRLVNLSARAHAGPGDGVLIVGFVISGDTPLRVLVRAVGPALTALGVTQALSDPQLDVYRGGTLVQHNDNWQGSSELADEFARVGAFALPDAKSKDAALIVTLTPGAYTAVVSGVAGTSGIALAEVYELP